MKIEIKNRWTGAVLYSGEAESVRELVEAANLADANLAGANLAGANLAGANLADAYLADANLAGANLADAYLADANLAGANLAGAYLAGAYLAGAYLAGAKNVPSGTEKSDPTKPYKRVINSKDRSARAKEYRKRYPEVPVIEKLDKKILEVVESGKGKLDMGAWHSNSCKTTHCRAGWAITLAGEKGASLEAKVGPQHAGRLIYLCSTGRAPHFFATNERAMEDIRECAKESK